MAKILFGVGVADARNKLGGHVFSKNRNGAYVRQKVSPSQPRSAAQLNVRASFTAFSKAWGGILTPTQRAGWISLAASFPVTDQFGNPQTLTGLQMYMRVNRNLATIATARMDSAPADQSANALTSLTPAAAAGAATFTVAFTPTPLAAGDHAVIFITPGMSAGRSFFTPFLKLIFADPNDATASPENVHAAYIARFGALVAGQRIGVTAFTINEANGAASTPSSALITVAA